MSESALWREMRAKLSPFGDLERVENLVGVGTPDVNYCLLGREGWVELKEVDALPKRSSSAVRVPHYTKQQRVWQVRRGRAGGNVYVLVRVLNPKRYWLFNWRDAVEYLGSANALLLDSLSLVGAPDRFPVDLVVNTLSGRLSG